MRHLGLILLLALSASCKSQQRPSTSEHWVTTYYDRNHDGIVDFELHALPGGYDTDWAFSDTNCRGRYNLRIHWGYALEKTRVDIPVPKSVPITPGQPAVSPIQ